MSLSAVILAGGKSSRMGEDKALMPFVNSTTMTEYQYLRLKKLFKQVFLSAKEDKFAFGADIILDNYPESSPMVAIASILEELNDDFFLISVDMPLLSLEAIEKLISVYNSARGYDCYLLKSPNGLEPTAAIYSKQVAEKVKLLLAQDIHKLHYLIERINVKSVAWEIIEDFTNINDKESYKYAKSQIYVK